MKNSDLKLTLLMELQPLYSPEFVDYSAIIHEVEIKAEIIKTRIVFAIYLRPLIMLF